MCNEKRPLCNVIPFWNPSEGCACNSFLAKCERIHLFHIFTVSVHFPPLCFDDLQIRHVLSLQ